MCHRSIIYSTPEVWDQHSILTEKAKCITDIREGERHLLGTANPV